MIRRGGGHVRGELRLATGAPAAAATHAQRVLLRQPSGGSRAEGREQLAGRRRRPRSARRAASSRRSARRPAAAPSSGSPSADAPVQRGREVVVVGGQPPQPVELLGAAQMGSAATANPGSSGGGRAGLGPSRRPRRAVRRRRPGWSPASGSAPRPPSGRWATTSDFSTSESTRSSTSSASILPRASRADRLGRLQRPAAGEDRRRGAARRARLRQQVPAPVDDTRAACAGGAGRCGCRATAAGTARRADAVRPSPDDPSRAAISAADSERSRAAASSMASGSPSSAAQIRSTASLSPVQARSRAARRWPAP